MIPLRAFIPSTTIFSPTSTDLTLQVIFQVPGITEIIKKQNFNLIVSSTSTKQAFILLQFVMHTK